MKGNRSGKLCCGLKLNVDDEFFRKLTFLTRNYVSRLLFSSSCVPATSKVLKFDDDDDDDDGGQRLLLRMKVTGAALDLVLWIIHDNRYN